MRTVIGFTLLELLIAMLVFAILCSLSIPFGSTWLQRQRVQNDVQLMMRRIQAVRLAAIEAGTALTFCASQDRQTCGGQWQKGQIVFIDHNGDHQRSAAERLVASYGPLSHSAQLTWHGFYSRKYLMIEPSGIGRARAGHFAYVQGDYHHKLIMSRTGRLRLE